MKGLSLRNAVADDGEFVYQTVRSAFREYVEKAWGWDEDRQRQLHERRFTVRDFRIICLGDEQVGLLACSRTEQCLMVRQLFLMPEFQGRGIGRECMERVLAEGGSQGLPVRLAVLKVNPRAQAFYRRLGFALRAETDTHVLMETPGEPAG